MCGAIEGRALILVLERALGERDVRELLVAVGAVALGLCVEPDRLGLEQIGVRDRADDGRRDLVGALAGPHDVLERVEVGVDGAVDVHGPHHEDDRVGGLGAQLDEDRGDGGLRVVVLGGPRSLLHAARVEERQVAPRRLDLVPAPPARLSTDVPDLGDLAPHEGVDHRGLAGSPPADDGEGGRPLLDHERPQRSDAVPQVLGGVAGQHPEQRFEALERLGDLLACGLLFSHSPQDDTAADVRQACLLPPPPSRRGSAPGQHRDEALDSSPRSWSARSPRMPATLTFT